MCLQKVLMIFLAALVFLSIFSSVLKSHSRTIEEWQEPNLATGNIYMSKPKNAARATDLRDTFKFDYEGQSLAVDLLTDFIWLSQGNVIVLPDGGGDRRDLVFWRKNRHYILLNHADGIQYVNEILRDFRVRPGDFQDPNQMDVILRTLVDLCGSPYDLPATKYFFSTLPGLDYSYVRELGLKKGKNAFKDFFTEPVFKFDKNHWQIGFNVITIRGGMDTWLLAGSYDTHTERLHIHRVDIRQLKPELSINLSGILCDYLTDRSYKQKPGITNKEEHHTEIPENSGAHQDLLDRMIQEFPPYVTSWRCDTVGDQYVDWLQRGELIECRELTSLNYVRFWHWQGKYHRINCKEGIRFLNQILTDYSFSEAAFSDSEKVLHFAKTIGWLYGDVVFWITSKEYLKELEEEDSVTDWLVENNKKEEQFFRQLFHDPRVTTEGNQYKIVFNLIDKKGAAKRWTIRGQHNSDKNYNQIDDIEIDILRKEGSLFCPYGG